jgi:hypothetical protein
MGQPLSREGSIHVLLGLPREVDAERLRAAYEGAVAAATARQDWRRAAQLSAAFDALPNSVRLAVYSGRERDAARWAPTGRTSESGMSRRSRRGGFLRRSVLIIGAAGVAAFGIVNWLPKETTSTNNPVTAIKPAAIAATHAPVGRTSSKAARTAPIPATTWSPMRSLYPGSGEVMIPVDAVISSDGMAHVSCPDSTGQVWSTVAVRPGQLFVCPSGFVGRVLVRVAH